VGLDELDKVPELPKQLILNFLMFRELPAWGFYVRHARNIIFENVKLIAAKKDYRRAIVLDDAHIVRLKGLQVQEPGSKKDLFYAHKSTDVKIEK